MAGVRKDAVRNRQLLVAAAREVFAEKGFEATLDEIAARAGVGTGTAYRNFADKRELAAEILAEATEQIALDARAALEVEDPWEALVAFFSATAARQAAEGGLYQALAGQGRADDKVRLWPEIVEAVGALFDRAHAAGAIRADLQAEDVVAAIAMVRAVDPARWPRYLALLLDGMRATDRPPLPGAAPRYGSLDDMVDDSKGRRRSR